MIIISAHSDTNFKNVSLRIKNDSYVGYLDNYVGVYSSLKAFFSGKIDFDYVRLELTYGEETDFGGAIEVAKEIKPDDLAIVIDVTATPTEKDFVIEKCKSDIVEMFLRETLQDFHYDFYKDCPDPVSDRDEVEVYKEKTDYYFFLGLPCSGGDYNSVDVSCRIKSVDETARAIIEICKNYKNFKNKI